MICAYIDEAGSTGKKLNDKAQPYHYMGALLIKEDCWRAVNKEVSAIVEKERKRSNLSSEIELHGSELYHGAKTWKHLSNDPIRRMSIYSDCIDLLEKYDLRMVYGRCNKTLLQKYNYKSHPHYIAFLLCLERIAKHLNQNGSLGFIVADDSPSNMQTIVKECICEYRKNGPPFGRKVDISGIIDTVHFMDSKDSKHIQLCDLALFAIQRQDIVGDIGYIYNKVKVQVTDFHSFPY